MTEENPFVADQPPLPLRRAVPALARCVTRVASLLAERRISQPRERVGAVLEFADGTHGRVYRGTQIVGAPTDAPALLVVAFRLRWVRGRGHALFRAESLLNTVLFAGFPGLVSKLWLAHDEHGAYRGFYQWNDARLADAYVRALWWVLALVSVRGSIRSVVVPGLTRDHVLADPDLLARTTGVREPEWWRLTTVVPAARGPRS